MPAPPPQPTLRRRGVHTSPARSERTSWRATAAAATSAAQVVSAPNAALAALEAPAQK